MDLFLRQNSALYCENVSLARLAAEEGTPAYVYSATMIKRQCQAFRGAFGTSDLLPCFAVKSNSNLSVLQCIGADGFGADIVSGGELTRASIAGIEPRKMVFSGVGKTKAEVEQALAAQILAFNVESLDELSLIESVARAANRTATIALRVNPDIDARTHEKIATGLAKTKFGLPEKEIGGLATHISKMPHLSLEGLACHIGSQITDLAPIAQAAQRLANLVAAIRGNGARLTFINMGGGLGIRYRDETPPALDDYAATLIRHVVRPTGLKLVLEPGRVIVGQAGVLLSRVVRVKPTPAKTFVILDAAMNDLIRPSLYGAWHDVEPVNAPQSVGRVEKGPDARRDRGEDRSLRRVNEDRSRPSNEADGPFSTRPGYLCDFVGPVCETGDYLALDRSLPALPKAGDLFVLRDCGAYGASMASQYNSRPRPAEIMVSGSQYRVVRPREPMEDLWASERALLEGPN